MSNFICEKCGTHCIDSPEGYITGCEHYPADIKSQGNNHACMGIHPQSGDPCPERERCRRWHGKELNGPLMHMVCYGKKGYPYFVAIESAKL